MTRTPKRFRPPHKRKPNGADHTKNVDGWRVEASWNARPDDRPAILRTQDRRRAQRKAQEWAEAGGYVILQRHLGWDRWETVTEIDGPALVATAREQRAEDDAMRQLASACWPQPAATYEPDASDRVRSWLDWMTARTLAEQQQLAAATTKRRRIAAEAATSSRTLMAAPANVRTEQQRRVRHTAGER